MYREPPDYPIFSENGIITPEWEKYAIVLLSIVTNEIGQRKEHQKEYIESEKRILASPEVYDAACLELARELIIENSDILQLRTKRQSWCIRVLGLRDKVLNS